MYRVEQLREVDGVLHVVGQYTTIEDTGFALEITDGEVKFANAYTIRFPRATDPYVVTHVGFFPLTEYTGFVARLNVALTVGREGEVSFKRGAITITQVDDGIIRTAVKGTP